MKNSRTIVVLLISSTLFYLSCHNKSSESNTRNADTSFSIKNDNLLANDSSNKIWDIPRFICLNIDELKKYFIDSRNVVFDSNQARKENDSKIKEVALQMKDNILFAGYNDSTREVLYYFIDAIESKSFSADGATSDISDLLGIAGVLINAENYFVEPIPSVKNEKRYTGIKIIPKCNNKMNIP